MAGFVRFPSLGSLVDILGGHDGLCLLRFSVGTFAFVVLSIAGLRSEAI